MEADYFAAPPGDRGRSKPLIRDFLEILVFALALYIAIQAAVQTVHVEGHSMVPTLQNNDLLIAVKVQYWFETPQRGDIIILKPNAPADPNSDFIKRVIGLPGERIHITDGQVYINDRRLTEPYLPPAHSATFPIQGGDYLIPSGHYFVLGDNREHSSDSRVFCSIPAASVEGRAVLRIWPLDTFGFLAAGPLEAPSASSDTLSPGTCP